MKHNAPKERTAPSNRQLTSKLLLAVLPIGTGARLRILVAARGALSRHCAIRIHVLHPFGLRAFAVMRRTMLRGLTRVGFSGLHRECILEGPLRGGRLLGDERVGFFRVGHRLEFQESYVG